MIYNISLDNTFQGPLDLLLHLVKRDEIDIHDIPVSHLTKEYIKELDKMQDNLDVDMAAEFLAVASMLVEIKSRMLLPPIETEEDEDGNEILDPRAGLVHALLEYKKFKEAAAALGNMADEHAQRFARLAPIPKLIDEDATIEDANSLDLLLAFQTMVRSLSTRKQEIVNDEVPTEIRIDEIAERIQKEERFTFSSMLSDDPSKGELVGYFIALMEIIRLRKARAQQSDDFTEIYIVRLAQGQRTDFAKPERTLIRTDFRKARKHAELRGKFAKLFSKIDYKTECKDKTQVDLSFPDKVPSKAETKFQTKSVADIFGKTT